MGPWNKGQPSAQYVLTPGESSFKRGLEKHIAFRPQEATHRRLWHSATASSVSERLKRIAPRRRSSW